MKTLYITKGNNMVIDTDNKMCDSLDSQRIGIDRIYIADEPMHVIYNYKDIKEEYDVSAGDLIIVFYVEDFAQKIVVVHADDWLANIVKYNEIQQTKKEDWAKDK